MTTNDGVIDTPDDGIAPHPLEAPRPSDELYQAFPNQAVPMGIDPKDGLPTPRVPHSIQSAKAPPLDPERFVCMADGASFVIRNAWGDAVLTFEPNVVKRAPDGRYRVPWATLNSLTEMEAALKALSGAGLQGPRAETQALSSLGVDMALARSFEASGWLEVEPLRPQCKHYRRQYKDFTDDSEHQHVIRLCTARQSDAGEYLSLGDSEMLACELRSPAYGSNSELIDEFDDRAIALGREVKDRGAEFDIDAELDGEAGSGIFGGVE